jgi:hypothetical protein
LSEKGSALLRALKNKGFEEERVIIKKLDDLGISTTLESNKSLPFHTPSDLVVDHWTSGVESNSLLDFLLRHALWTPLGRLISCKIMSIISVACDFTTKSGGIWTFQQPYRRISPKTCPGLFLNRWFWYAS